jgi:signal transduction histidine kinase
MVETSELLHRIPAFDGLPDDQIAWFLSQSKELHLNQGDSYARQGEPADAMFVLLEGEFQWRGELAGESFVLEIHAGEITGILPFSRMKQFTLSGRAMTEARVLRFPAALFPQLVQKMPELATRLVGLMSDRIREATRFEQQRDRLAALGKLSAGLAHELNNPASAAKRAASQLRDILKRVRDASHELGRRDLTAAQKSEIEKLESSLIQLDGPPPDALTISDLEEQIDSLLRSHGQPDLWQLASDLAHKNFKPAALEHLFAALDADTARAALVRISASLKTLETTLTILNHKLKRGVTVQRDYQKIPLLVNSFGSELNQIWTNIIDNAIDAMGGKGELRVRTHREDDCVVVEIGDNGPGISPVVRPHIFEPFFTTKAVGQGTGLGLDTVQRIVRKHRGNIQVHSKPGDTRFQVRLPLSESAAA